MKKSMRHIPGLTMTNIISFFQRHSSRNDRLEVLIRPHIGSMYRMAYRWAQNRQDAEDLVQETLVKLVTRVDELEGVDKPGSWLIKILYRCFIDLQRRKMRRPEAEGRHWEADVSLFDELSMQNSDNENFVRRLALQRELVQALETLSDEQRNVVLLHDTEGYTADEVAAILGISTGTVKSRLHRVREQLKKVLEPGTF